MAEAVSGKPSCTISGIDDLYIYAEHLDVKVQLGPRETSDGRK